MSADLLKRLAAAGTPMDLIMEVAETLAEARAAERLLEKRRASDRERKVVANPRIPRNSTEALETAEEESGKEKSPDPYKKISPPVEAKASTAPRGRSDRGSKISESWVAPPIAELTPEAKALAERWPAAAYRAEAEAFRNYWLGESSAKARKSDWNRTWSNRIVAVNGKVMRDAKFSGAINLVGKASSAPMNAAQLRSAIAFAEDNDNPERAAELRRQLSALSRQTGPPRAIGELISRASSGRV